MDSDFDSYRESIDWRIKSGLSNKGITGASVSTELSEQSGEAKKVDEKSLEEKRVTYRSILHKFELDLLNKIRTVWNYHVGVGDIPEGKKLNEDGEFKVILQEEKPFETIEQKSKRREFELKFKVMEEVEILMEEKELTEDEVIEILKARKVRQEKMTTEGVAIIKTNGEAPQSLRDRLGLANAKAEGNLYS